MSNKNKPQASENPNENQGINENILDLNKQRKTEQVDKYQFGQGLKSCIELCF